MLEKILNYNNLGTKSQILYLLDLLSKGDFLRDDLARACSSKDYTYSNSFNGIVELLLWLGIIKEGGLLSLSKSFTQKNFLKNFTILLFTKLSQEKELHNFLNQHNILYDQESQSIFLKNNLIHYRFSSFRNLLFNIGLILRDDLIDNQFIVNEEYVQWFIETIIPLIEKSQFKNVSLKALEALQNRQKEVGFEAELFVLNYEKEKRTNHPKNKNIQIISELDVTAGYDIVSYQTDSSIILDKFIEVKSYPGDEESFFWSSNEINAAENKKNEYFLYLVDRSKMHEANYEPTILQNPCETVLKNTQWNKKIEKYFISREKTKTL